MINLLVSLLFSMSAFAQFELSIEKKERIYTPGSIVEATIEAPSDLNVSEVSPNTIKNGIDKKFFLVFYASPWEKTAEGWRFNTKLVLGPEFKPYQKIEIANAPNRYVQTPDIKWNAEIGNVPQSYIYNEQELFSLNWFLKNKYISISLGLLVFVTVCFFGKKYYNLQKHKREKKRILSQMLSEVEGADSLQKLSEIWRKRDDFKELFFNRNKSLDEFFSELNQIQFKPRVEANELKKVYNKKDILLSELREELSGI